MIILSIFGTTRGLEVINFPLSNHALPFQIENQWLEVSLDEINLKPNQDTVQIHRRMIAGNMLTWIGVYQHIFEVGYQRRGSFLGAGAWLVNSIVPAEILLPVLKSIVVQLKDKATNQGQFTKTIDEIKNEFLFNPADLTAYENPLTHGLSPYVDLGFFAAKDHPIDVKEMLDWAQSARGADLFNRGYISPQDTFVTQAAGSTRKQINLRNRNEADALYARKLGEVSEQLNHQTHQLNEQQQNLSNAEQQINQLKVQNASLSKEALNLKDMINQQRLESDRVINSLRLDNQKKVSQLPVNPTRSAAGANLRAKAIAEPIKKSKNWEIWVISCLSLLIAAGIGALATANFMSSDANDKNTRPTSENQSKIESSTSSSPSVDLTTVVTEDAACKDLHLNSFLVTFTASGYGDTFRPEQLAKRLIKKVCKSPSSFEKYSACKTKFQEFTDAVQNVNSKLKGEVKLPDYCVENDPKFANTTTLETDSKSIDVTYRAVTPPEKPSSETKPITAPKSSPPSPNKDSNPNKK